MTASLPFDSSDTNAYRKRLALALSEEGTSTAPVGHWTQGLARMTQAIVAAQMANQLGEEQGKKDGAYSAALQSLPGLGGGAPAPVPVADAAQPAGPSPQMVAALAQPADGFKRATPAYMKDVIERNVADPDMRSYYGSLVGGEAPNGPRDTSPTGARGPFQFIPSTAKQYGLTNPEDPEASLQAVQRFTADNAATFQRINGRQPTLAELALMHQQGGTTGARMVAGTGNASPYNLSVNNVNPQSSSAEAVARIKSYYGMPDRPAGAAQPQLAQADPAALPPNAQYAAPPSDAQGYAIPGQPQAQPQQAPAQQEQPQIPHGVQQQIRTYMSSPDPRVKALGMQLYQSEVAKFEAKDRWVEQRDPATGSFYQKNARTGEIKVVEKSDVLPQAALDQKLQMAQAGRTQVTQNVDQKGETEFSKANAKHQSERFNKLIVGAGDAKGMISNVQSLRDIGSRITTGKSAETAALLGPYAESFGIKIDGLDDLQAYKSIVARIAPSMRIEGSGTSSDRDISMFLEGLPGLGKTKGGNEIISQTLDAFAQHKIAAGDIASRAVAGELSARDAEKELRALPDPLTLWKQSRGKPDEPLGAPVEIDGYKIRAK